MDEFDRLTAELFGADAHKDVDISADLSGDLSGDSSEHEKTVDFPWVLFSVNNVVYAVFSTHVLSIEILGEATPLVNSPAYSRGITNFRGDMIALIDIRTLFCLPSREERMYAEGGDGAYDAEQRDMVVVLEVDGVVKGIIVDDIVSVEYINRILDMEGLDQNTEFIKRLGKREKDNSTVQMIDEEKIIRL